MLLSELLDTPHLRLRLRYEAPGGLDRAVERVVSTALPEPGRYVTGADTVITELSWRQAPDDSEVFVASIAGCGVATLLTGTALLGAAPEDLIAACRHYEVTLVEVPPEVTFTEVTDHIAAATAADSGDALSASLMRQRELLGAIAAGRTLDQLASRLSATVGHTCRVLTPTGRHVVSGPGDLDPATVDVITQRFLTADLLPAVADASGTPYSIFPVGSGFGSRLTGWMLVADGDHTTWPRVQVEAVRELATVAALDRSRRDEGLRAVQPIAADALALIDSGARHSEVAARVRQAGLASDTRLVVVVAEVADGGTKTADAAVELLADVALAVGPAILAPGHDGLPVALLPATDGLAEKVRTAFSRLTPGLGPSTRIAVGLSSATGHEALAGALEQARFAHQVARNGGGRVSVIGSDEVTSHALLLAAVPDDVRRTYAHRVLGPVLESDRRTGGDLVATLTEFLHCSGSWARTADQLHLHVNTVRYRIQRVQELTGRDLSRLEDRVDVFLALESL